MRIFGVPFILEIWCKFSQNHMKLLMRANLRYLLLIVIWAITAQLTALANPSRLTCRYNYQVWIGVSRILLDTGFKFVWADGPSMVYKEVAGRSYADNLYIDSLGGQWHIKDHRNGRSFDLVNIENRNIIQCR